MKIVNFNRKFSHQIILRNKIILQFHICAIKYASKFSKRQFSIISWKFSEKVVSSHCWAIRMPPMSKIIITTISADVNCRHRLLLISLLVAHLLERYKASDVKYIKNVNKKKVPLSSLKETDGSFRFYQILLITFTRSRCVYTNKTLSIEKERLMIGLLKN
jgi:hypothetical protein